MQVVPRESLVVDTRAAPTPPQEPTHSAIHGALFGEYNTDSQTLTANGVLWLTDGSSNTHSTTPTASSTIELSSPPLYPSPSISMDRQTLSDAAIISTCLGGIVFILLLLLSLVVCTKRMKDKRRLKEKGVKGGIASVATRRTG